MKQFRNLFILGLVALAFVFGMVIKYATPSKTVDFRGEIRGVAVSDDGTVTIYATNHDAGAFIFRLDENSRLEDCCGGKIAVDDLTEGSSVDVIYRKYLFRDQDFHTVKRLRLYA